MSRFDFANLVLENIGTYIVVLILLMVLYCVVLKRFYIFILDPFIISQIFSLFASTVVVFLYVEGVINGFYFSQFSLTQIAYWCGLYYYNPNVLKRNMQNLAEKKIFIKPDRSTFEQTIFVFLYSSIIFVFLQLLSYVKFGIPLFLESRLALYEGSGGWGILGRVLNVLSTVVLFGSFYVYSFYSNCKWLKVYSIIVICFILLTNLLSGSKSSFLQIFSLFFLFLFLYNQSKLMKVRKFEKYLLLLVFLGAIFVINIQNDTEPSLHLFIDRLIGSGDVFYQGYFSDSLMQIEGTPITLLFSDILGTYRVINWDNLPKPIGMQLYSMVYNVDASMGANARHNYLGLVCFGFLGSIVFSYFLGWLVSYVRIKLYLKFCLRGFLFGAFYVLLLQAVSSLEGDSTIFIYSMNSIFVSLLFVILLLFGYFFLCYTMGKGFTTIFHVFKKK